MTCSSRPVGFRVAVVAVMMGFAGLAHGGPNLVPFGDFSDAPFKRIDGRDSVSGKEIIYESDDPAFDFGRIVVRSNAPNSVVRRDLFVGFNGALWVRGDVGGSNVSVSDVEFWLKLNGQLRSGATYEWEFQAYSDQDKLIEGGIPAMLPLFWANGEQIACEVTISEPEVIEGKISRLGRIPHGSVKLKEFDRQTGPAWVVIKPRNFGNAIGIGRISFREIDSDLAENFERALPVPIRYIPIRSAIESQIQIAMMRGPEALLRFQNEDGYWQGGSLDESVAFTAAILSAIQEAGYKDAPDRIQRGMRWLADQEIEDVEAAQGNQGGRRAAQNRRGGQTTEQFSVATVGQRLYCLSRHGGMSEYAAAINRGVQFLTHAQLADGGWGEQSGAKSDRGIVVQKSDHNNTSAAIYGLREAQLAGAPVDRRVWREQARYWESAQWYNGGFIDRIPEYGGLGGVPTPALTAVGATGMLITIEMGYSHNARSCQEYASNKSLLRGLSQAIDFLDENYKVQFRELQSFAQQPDPYAEPSAMQSFVELSGVTLLNERNPFTQAANDLFEHFDAGSGMFGVRGAQAPNPIRTAYALNAIAAGAAPIAIQRVVVGDDEAQRSQFSFEGAHLARYLGRKRDKLFNWRRAAIDMDIAELARVPITYIKIVGDFDWKDEDWQKIREYCFEGGTVVFNFEVETKALREALAENIKKTFPEYALRELPKEHDLFSMEEGIKSKLKVQSLSNGFRDFLFLPEESWTCAWHTFNEREHADEFAFMNNLLSYATDGTPLRTSFSPSPYAVGSSPNKQLTVAHIEVGGEIPAYPEMLDTLHRLSESTFRTKIVDVSDSTDRADLLWISVTGDQPMPAETKDRILQQLRDGGYVFMDVVSGKKEWADNVLEVLSTLDSDLAVSRLPRRSPLFTGKIPGAQGFDVVNAAFRKELQSRFVKRGRCDLYDLQWKGKSMGALSKYDIASGLGYNFFPECRGLMPDDSRAIALNVVLSAMEVRRQRGELADAR